MERSSIRRNRVLLISHNSLSLHSNNGKTLNAMFGEWGAEELAQLYFQEETPETTHFKRFFRVRDLDILKSLLLLASSCGSPIDPKAKVSSHFEGAGQIKSLIVDALRKTDSLKLLLRDLLYGTQRWRSRELLSWLNDFRPDSIFFVGSNSVFSFKIANELSAFARAPLDIFITDDYVLHARPAGVLSRFLNRRLLDTYRQAFKKARHVFVIGDDMASEFGCAFNRKFVPVMNAVEFPAVMPRKFATLENQQIDVVYAGGLHLGRDQSLVRFAGILKRVSEISGVPSRLSVYSLQVTPAALKKFNDHGVVYGGALSQEALGNRLAKADFVLHVESFEERYVRMTKLSVSTKLPEYLASGACLIAYGPSGLASIRLVENNAIGIALSEQDDEATLVSKLRPVFESVDERQRLALSGFEYARGRFSLDVVRRQIDCMVNRGC